MVNKFNNNEYNKKLVSSDKFASVLLSAITCLCGVATVLVVTGQEEMANKIILGITWGSITSGVGLNAAKFIKYAIQDAKCR